MIQQDIHHNSFEIKNREPFGAVPKGSNVSLSIDIHHQHQVLKVILHYIYDKSNDEYTEDMTLYRNQHQFYTYNVIISIAEEPQLIWYYFEVVTEEKVLYYGRVNIEESGEGMVYDHTPPSWQITVFDPDYQTPEWWKHATMYQIFPDRFDVAGDPKLQKAPKTSLMHTHWDNDPIYIKNEKGEVVRWDFFGGNLQGIRHRLDYIQSLGVTVIYLNPIFEAESNHRYDTGDYHRIDPLLGNEEDLKQLVKAASERNIEIMLDGVFSHTGSNSIYFNKKGEYHSLGAYQSLESPYHSWYSFDNHPDDYKSWWGIDTMPTLDKDNKDYQRFLISDEHSVIKTWQRLGLNHWRLDVADELTDDLIKQIYQQLKQNNASSVLLGEVWEDASNKMAYGKRRDYLLGGELDAVMNYPLRELMLDFIKGEITATYLHKRLMTLSEHYPKSSFYSVMNLLSSHDVERVKTVLNNHIPEPIQEQRDLMVMKQVKALSLWLYTFPGVPSLYYGDEVGLTGGEDPDNRKTYPWGREDIKLLEWYRTIGKWRRDNIALRTGSWTSHALHEDVYAFERWTNNGVDAFGSSADDQHFHVLFNRHCIEEREIPLPVQNGKWQSMLDHRLFWVEDDPIVVKLKPCEIMLLRKL